MFDSDYWPKWPERFRERFPQAGAAETSQGFQKSGIEGTWALGGGAIDKRLRVALRRRLRVKGEQAIPGCIVGVSEDEALGLDPSSLSLCLLKFLGSFISCQTPDLSPDQSPSLSLSF